MIFSAVITFTLFIPLAIISPQKLGVAPGGYQYGDFNAIHPEWVYRWNNQFYTETVYGLSIPQVDMIWSDQYFYMPVRSNTILGFNEIDLAGQADMTATQAAIGWHWIETTYPDKKLISPSCSQLHADCIWDMAIEYKRLYGVEPRFDGIAVHYYKWDFTQLDLPEYLMLYRASELAHGYNVPIWVTEFGVGGEIDGASYLDRVMPWVYKTDWVERVAWYKIRSDYYDSSPYSVLLDNIGITEAGRRYLNWTNLQPLY